MPRRSAAHGHQPICALPATRSPRHPRPLTTITPLGERRDKGRLRLCPRDRRRPLPPGLRRAPPRRDGSHRDRLRRARTRPLRRARHHRAAADDRQRLHRCPQPLTARTARQSRHPPPQDGAVPPTHERESRALPPDDGPRMGIRSRLPDTSTPKRRSATLAQPPQPATTAQLHQRPATHQPRSQRPWVGQLAHQAQANSDARLACKLRPVAGAGSPNGSGVAPAWQIRHRYPHTLHTPAHLPPFAAP
jgi:hypothetical protein